MQGKRRSIAKEISTSSWVLVTALLIPAIISLVVMLVYTVSYSESTARMEAVAALKPIVETQISDDLWYIVAGRETFESSGLYETIARVDGTLDSLMAQSNGEGLLELTVAQRTMNTMVEYVRKIEADLASGVPIVVSEDTLEEVRSVASLVNNMLENYIMQEVEVVAQRNVLYGRIVAIFAIVELLMLGAALTISAKMRGRMARSLNDPISQLEHFSDLLASGNLQARAPITDVEELVNLTDRFNIMAHKLESLIEQNQREQENLQKAELRTLQAQIHPHFLYNTLDTIVWQAEAGQSSEIIHITKALSDFFRISLSSGADWITVSQEIKHLSAYLAIQKIRYRDILEYEIIVAEDMMEMPILKLLLQPLVENALYHGIKHKRGGGKITVSGYMEDEFLHFTVTDTGHGMDAYRLRNVVDGMAGGMDVSRTEQQDRSGFGLNNVNQRICLHYRQTDGLHIQSDEKGTSVSFRVPANLKGEIL